ncbi:unnamed protein product [Adineta steineri]|uniref:Uncharacterized protein n=1 Tax=Adineta steineri TaxID=433720 RepID=A0A820ANS9_9BILA|nr:unnamed protein product [Adineta steineri]CAF4186155.1 unnamed protein product [Adineta steineri]
MTEDEDKIEVQLAKPYDLIQEKFQVNIRDLRSLKRDRSAIAHTRRKSDVEQQALIEKARCINMPSNFKHKKGFYIMIDELDAFDGKFYRMS